MQHPIHPKYQHPKLILSRNIEVTLLKQIYNEK